MPFYFALINSFKDQKESSLLNLSLPSSYHIVENYKQVLEFSDRIVARGFINSIIITFFTVIGAVIVCSMAAFVLQRREDKFSGFWSFMLLFGVIVPPAIVPTIWVLQALHIFKTLPSMILLEIAFYFPYAAIMYRGFMKTIPRELDEAAVIDGCGRIRLFFQIIFPLLKPVTITVILLCTLTVFNDFMNPLYFLPGVKNTTAPLTLYCFTGQYYNRWNLLFADTVLMVLPILILYIFLNKKLMAGMVAGALRG